MSDFLIDNKLFYKPAYYFVILFNTIIFALFISGIFQYKPDIVVEMNFFVKYLFAIFLVYRFNPFRKDKIQLTELDKIVCFTLGIYIIILSTLTLIVKHSISLKKYLQLHQLSDKTVDSIHVL